MVENAAAFLTYILKFCSSLTSRGTSGAMTEADKVNKFLRVKIFLLCGFHPCRCGVAGSPPVSSSPVSLKKTCCWLGFLSALVHSQISFTGKKEVSVTKGGRSHFAPKMLSQVRKAAQMTHPLITHLYQPTLILQPTLEQQF